MGDDEKPPTDLADDGRDPSADFVRDLATSSPPKSFQTVKAASNALENMEEQIRRRAFELWDQHGRPDTGQEGFWLTAEREVKASYGESAN